MPVLHQALRHVGAHATQSDHAQFHADSVAFAIAADRYSMAQARAQFIPRRDDAKAA
ncbi:hypothetical protein GCM10025759_07290 [Lysobacter panacisoli]|uniref:Uncharacterized protein n=1 Tax=Lysobacter panacisoli TaxID=1255263 RepID=A0ABP9L558_9GAMM